MNHYSSFQWVQMLDVTEWYITTIMYVKLQTNHFFGLISHEQVGRMKEKGKIFIHY